MDISNDNILFNKLTHTYINKSFGGGLCFVAENLNYPQEEVIDFCIHHAKFR